jgi:uncharacterized metal-binding protein YceD (DUF177 family)
VPEHGCDERVESTPEEREALARRLDLPALDALTALLRIEPARGKGLRVHGAVDARLTQTCVVTLEDFVSDLHVLVERFYVPESEFRNDPEEAEDEDVDLIRNGEIDLGELVSESLALAIDPYPRKPGVTFAGVSAEDTPEPGDRTRPFAGLARLKEPGQG